MIRRHALDSDQREHDDAFWRHYYDYFTLFIFAEYKRFIDAAAAALLKPAGFGNICRHNFSMI